MRYAIQTSEGFVGQPIGNEVTFTDDVNKAFLLTNINATSTLAESLNIKGPYGIVELKEELRTINVINIQAPNPDDNVAIFAEVTHGRDMDTVAVSDSVKHPVDFFSTYKDTTTDIVGKAVAVSYSSNGTVEIALKYKDDKGVSVSQYVHLNEIEPVDDSRFEPDIDPNLPVELGEKYREVDGEFEGKMSAIVFSSNKCIQAFITKIVDHKRKGIFFDLQDLEPVSSEVAPHGVTSNTNPGAPMSLPSIYPDYTD